MPLLRLNIFVLLILGVLFNASAQINLGRQERISVSKGLSDRTVNCITQDAEGFLWIGTDNGLNRYDGKNFLIYNNQVSNPYKISDNDISEIALGKYNTLLVFYKDNLDFIDIIKDGAKVSQKLNLRLISGESTNVHDVHLSRSKRLFLLATSSKGTVVYEYDYTSFLPLFQLPTEIKTAPSNLTLLADKNETTFWIKNKKGKIWSISNKGRLLKTYTLPRSNEKIVKHVYFRSIFHQTKKGLIWISFDDRNGVYHIPSLNDSLTLFEAIPSDEHFGYLWEDDEGNVIIGNNKNEAVVNQLYLVEPDWSFTDISFISNIEDLITHIFSHDFKKSILLSSHMGIRIFPVNQSKKIEHILGKKLEPNEKWGKSMKGITGNGKDKIYIAREVKHWYEYDLETKQVEPLEMKNPETNEAMNINCSSQLILEEDTLWGSSCAGYRFGYLHKYNLKNKTQELYKFKYPISCLTRTSDGYFWVGQQEEQGIYGELIRFDPRTGEQLVFRTEEGNPFEKSRPCFIMESSQGQLWVGTVNGLFFINRSTGTTRTWRVNNGDKNTFSGNYFMTIHEDKDKRLWLGTNGGLNIWDLETGKIQTYTEKDGLSNNSVCGIIPYNDSLYWLSTFNGITYFDTKNKIFGTFNEGDGFSHYEFNRFSYYKDHNNRMYFGGLNGVNAFNTEELLKRETTPPIILTKFSNYIARKDSLAEETQSLSKLTEVVIKPETSYFQFDFVLPVYYNAKFNQFKAWLEGYEKDWQYLGNTPSVRYNRLPAGTYTLHLKGADSKGNWSSDARRITIHVTEPFYKKLWFILLCSFLAIALSLGYYRWHLYRLKVKNELLEAEVLKRTETIREQAEELRKLDIIKSRIFAIIGHDLRKPAIAFRGIVKKVNYLLRKQDFESLEALGEEIEKDALGLNALIDNVLNWALAQQNTLPHKPEELNVNEVVQEVFLSLTTLAKEKKIRLTSKIRADIFVVADRSGLQTILRNLIDNAIKYSPSNDIVTVSSKPSDIGIDIEVRDNGAGIPSNKLNTIFLLQKDKSTKGTAGEKGMGLGLHLVHELVKANQGKIRVESELGKGTVFYLSFLTKLNTVAS